MSDSPPTVLLAVETLTDLVERCFAGAGVDRADAAVVAEVLVYADLRGIDSHGITRVPNYLARVSAGLAGGSERMAAPRADGATARLDAGHALGPAAARRAIDLSVELAREHGLGLVALARATHFGAAGFYARRAATRGMVALVLSNAPRNVAPFGAAEPFVGTNPLALAVPVGRHGEFVLDMSTSVVPRGLIRRAAARGQALAPGMALDAEGRPTTDAAAALEGSLLPVGGPKGSGLAMGISLLAALLAGGDFDDEMDSMYEDFSRPQNLGQAFLAIDPWRFGDRDAATARLEGLVDRLHALAPAEGFGQVLFAGEDGDLCERERRRAGIPVELRELRRIAEACRDAGIDDVARDALALAGELPARAATPS